MEKKIFQSGGPIIDEDECLEDGLLLKGKNQLCMALRTES
jgi:hypothetical protein